MGHLGIEFVGFSRATCSAHISPEVGDGRGAA
jgi:hypothetical protein